MGDNARMLYCIAELRNYKQLMRLRAASLSDTEAALTSLLATWGPSVIPAGQGVWVVELGRGEAMDADAAASFLGRVADLLGGRRDELFGYAVLAAQLPETGARAQSGAAQKARGLLAQAERDERLWLTPECATLFAEQFQTERDGSLHRVIGRGRATPRARQPALNPAPWVRQALLDRALDIIAPRLNAGEPREVLLLHGPPGVGKTALLREIGKRLRGGAGGPPVLRTHTIFKRRSPVHPFLNSIVPSVLGAVPRHLRGPELAVWSEVGGLLAWLRGLPREGEGTLLPDHLLEDFALGYRLYLQAWVRMSSERFLPAFFACDDIDSYHPAARRIAARLIDDLLACPEFLPALSSSRDAVPEEFAGLDVRPLYIHPLGKREIRSLSQHLFPGLEMPESLARRLRRRSAGQCASAVSSLLMLEKTGRIRASGDRYEWVPGDDEEALPSNPLSVSWYLIRSLRADTFLILYALHLAGGLLDRGELLAFLGQAGFDAATAGRSLESLLLSGLVAEEETPVPRFPALRKKLEDLLGAEGAGLKDTFIRHMLGLWNSGNYRHSVLLFSFLARNGRTDLALRVLPDIIRRKLDEGDVAGARAFCDPDRLEFAVPPTEAEAGELAAVTAAGRLRAALRAGELEAARRAHEELRPAAGREVQTESAKLSLAVGDSDAALETMKRVMLSLPDPPAQGAQAVRNQSAASLWLGAAMLAAGRIGEAVEYLGLSERLGLEAGGMSNALAASVFLATSLFIDGRYSRCLATLAPAGARARGACSREAELFLAFLEARALFQLGSYDECSVRLQGCLCIATLYSIEPAFPVLRAWLGRTLVCGGNPESGVRLLERLAETREVLFFLAEGSLFAGALEKAAECADRGLALPAESSPSPLPEGIAWIDGFTPVEGRCIRLGREETFLRRTISALRSYLCGLRGFPEEGIRELHLLTRGDKTVDEDPNAYWYNYLYSLVLPEAGSEEPDDKATVLGKSLRGLQERASRIDVPAARGSFLSRNVWNRRIMEDARERKLV